MVSLPPIPFFPPPSTPHLERVRDLVLELRPAVRARRHRVPVPKLLQRQHLFLKAAAQMDRRAEQSRAVVFITIVVTLVVTVVVGGGGFVRALCVLAVAVVVVMLFLLLMLLGAADADADDDADA